MCMRTVHVHVRRTRSQAHHGQADADDNVSTTRAARLGPGLGVGPEAGRARLPASPGAAWEIELL